MSTGPNVLAWAEWEYWMNFGDRVRLGRVYPVLLAYHEWMRRFRTWPDGSCECVPCARRGGLRGSEARPAAGR